MPKRQKAVMNYGSSQKGVIIGSDVLIGAGAVIIDGCNWSACAHEKVRCPRAASLNHQRCWQTFEEPANQKATGGTMRDPSS